MQWCRVADLQLATDTDGELKGSGGPSAGRGRPSIDSDSAGLVAPGGAASPLVPPSSHGYRGHAAQCPQSERSQMVDLVMARHWTLMAS